VTNLSTASKYLHKVLNTSVSLTPDKYEVGGRQKNIVHNNVYVQTVKNFSEEASYRINGREM
jgi:hypothetical protein